MLIDNKYKHLLLCLFAFFVPLKLSLALCALVPLIVVCLWENKKNLKRITQINCYQPLFYLILCMLLCLPFGATPLQSASKILGFFFYSLSIPTVALFVTPSLIWQIFAALVFGQSIAAYHSVLEASFPNIVSRLFVGTMSESGQLVLSLFAASGLLVFFYQRLKLKDKNFETKLKLYLFLSFTLNLGLLCVAGFSSNYSFFNLAPFLMLSFILLSVTLLPKLEKYYPVEQKNLAWFYNTLLIVALPLILSAFILNLKRGPWLGVLFSIIVFLAIFKRKLLLPTLATLIIIGFLAEPIRTRVESSRAQFMEDGSRLEMWKTGFEMGIRHPLGLGFYNSKLMLDYNPRIATNQRHLHNNLLNIWVELGVPALLIFLYWIFQIIKIGLKNPHVYSLSCCFGILAWQSAGLVEYNFGDSEVMLLAFLMIGILASITDAAKLEI